MIVLQEECDKRDAQKYESSITGAVVGDSKSGRAAKG